MARLLFSVVALFTLFASCASAAEIVFRDTFDDAPKAWQGVDAKEAAVVDVAGRSKALRVQTRERGNLMITMPLPIEQVRGSRVTLAASVKAENVAKPNEPWNGVKLMLVTQSPAGPTYSGLSDLHGSFDWREIGVPAVVPKDATEASIVVGLQDSNGTVWFDDIRLTINGQRRKIPAVRPSPLPTEKLDRRTEIPRLRGVMYGPWGKEEDLREFARWGGNLIRWQMYNYEGTLPESRLDLAKYDRWFEKVTGEIDRFLPLCESLGIRVVIDLHTPPGGGASGEWAMFRDKACQDKFIECWDKLVRRYKDQKVVWAYDLINEPAEGSVAEGLMDWRTLAEHVAKRVRAIDPHKAIIIEPGPHGGWENLPFFEPIDVPGIIYSVHMYEPLDFTHQGVLDGSPRGAMYPGVIKGKRWDRAALKAMLDPVRQYQLDYNVPVYIGEFSAPRWAPNDSAADYLRDCISIFEEFGWDWSYHAFREWHGWNVELGSDPEDKSLSPTPTSRQNVLMEGFKQNRR